MNDEPPQERDCWSAPISEKRKAELQALADQQREWEAKSEAERGDSRFKGVGLTGADVYWLAARVLAGSDEHQAVAAAMDRLNQVQEDTAGRHRLNLSALHLQGANLRGAKLSHAFLEGVVLADADLNDADLRDANLGHADLIGANLTHARLAGTNLVGAALSYAHVDSVGVLGDVIIGSEVDLSDVYWSDMPETHDTTVGTREEQAVACRGNVRVLRHASRVLHGLGLTYQASEYRLREQRMERQALWKEQRLGSWFFSWLLDLIAGYGERLGRILLVYGVTLLVFTALYWVMGVHSFPHEPGLQALWDSFLVSLSAIHGRTTFEQLGASSGAAWVAAIESVFGIVIEGVFVAMLVQRFFAR